MDDTGIVYATWTIPTYDPNNIPIVSYDNLPIYSNTSLASNDKLQRSCNISYTSHSSCEVPNKVPIVSYDKPANTNTSLTSSELEVRRGVPRSQFENYMDPRDWYKLYRLPYCTDFVYMGHKHNPVIAAPTNLHNKYPTMVHYAAQIKSTMTRTEFATIISRMFRELETVWTDFKVCPHGDSVKLGRYDETERYLLEQQDFPDNCRVTWFSRLDFVDYQYERRYSILNIAIANKCSKLILET